MSYDLYFCSPNKVTLSFTDLEAWAKKTGPFKKESVSQLFL